MRDSLTDIDNTSSLNWSILVINHYRLIRQCAMESLTFLLETEKTSPPG